MSVGKIEEQLCFHIPGKHHYVELITPGGNTGITSGQTLEEIQGRAPGAVVRPVAAVLAEYAAWKNAPIVWEPSDAEAYDEALNVLPPAEFGRGGFLVGEEYDQDDNWQSMFQAYICRGRGEAARYFKSSRPMTVKEFRTVALPKLPKPAPVELIGRYARSIESGWLGKVVAVEGEGDDVMLKMQGVNELCRTIAGGELDAWLDDDDTQWFSPDDVRLVKVVGELAARAADDAGVAVGRGPVGF